ncbi:MAG: LacI family DNA-binding transcriptional regulator [Oceanospirillaceae bacterium]|nr:LacI family DNA-binding transcriptional regulator [Oceanospirillaceae bacterium]
MQQNNKKMTIVTMAQRLDVSTATISNAFNRPDQLSAELRERILDECRRSGYDGPRRSRQKGRRPVLGLMLDGALGDNLANPETGALIRGLGEELDRQQYSLLLLSGLACRNGAPLPMVDGLIYWRTEGRRLDKLSESSVVAMECNVPGCVSIRIDQYTGGRIAARHGMREAGGTVAILGLGLLDSDRVCRVEEAEALAHAGDRWRQRLRGYLDGLEEAGAGRALDRIWHLPDSGPAAARQAVCEALDCNPRPRLLLCMDDRIAAIALEVAAERGLRVPDDLRVIGFGDASPKDEPLLTSLVPAPAEERGRLAARMLFGEIPLQDQLLTPRLLPGKSCP